jgi:hypothetical protein
VVLRFAAEDVVVVVPVALLVIVVVVVVTSAAESIIVDTDSYDQCSNFWHLFKEQSKITCPEARTANILTGIESRDFALRQ